MAPRIVPTGRRWRALLAVAAFGLAAAIAACSSTDDDASAASSGEATEAPAWEPCTGEGRDGLECSTLTVPRDWDAPDDGDTLEIALIRAPSTSDEPKGALLVNWGGPGAPGTVSLPGFAEVLLEATGGELDIVSWDPRGLAESTPISCPEGNEAYFDADPTTETGVAQMTAAVQERAAACLARYGPEVLGTLGTIQGVRDLDAIRQALGVDQIDFLGHSYGTRVGSVYAAMFPDRIRHMVLDGSLDPTSTLRSTALGDAVAYEAALERWLSECSTRPSCPFGADAVRGYDELVARIRAEQPLVPGTDERMTVGLLNQVVTAAIINYNGSTEAAEQVIGEYLRTGDPTQLHLLGEAAAGRHPDGTRTNSPEIFQFVNCQDWTDRPTPDQVRSVLAEAAAIAPRLGAAGAALAYVNGAGCPVEAAGTPIPTSPHLPPSLVVAGVTDAQTPLPWGQALSANLPNSQLLVSRSLGHTAFYTNPCVTERAGRFLATGELPPPGTVCPDGST